MFRFLAVAAVSLLPIAAQAHTGPDMSTAQLQKADTLSLALHGGDFSPVSITCPMPLTEDAPVLVLLCAPMN